MRTTDAEVKGIEREFQGLALHADNIYMLSSPEGLGYVIAVAMFHTEDAGEYYDPNPDHSFSNL